MVKPLMRVRAGRPQGVVEREVLRVVATLGTLDHGAAFERARREILVWAQNRTGSVLPPAAWKGEEFEHLAGGRTVHGVPFEPDGGVVWGVRADDPDKHVPGRVWTTEATIGKAKDGPPQLSVRLKASSSESGMQISPHVPGFVHQIDEKCELYIDGIPIHPRPEYLQDEVADLDKLIALVESPSRRLPVIVASGDERSSDPNAPLIDVDSLAHATFGLAHVIVLPASGSYALSDAFGRMRSVFHGGIRTYLRGFDASADPSEHRLYLGQVVCEDPVRCETDLRRFVAAESLRRTRLGDDVVAFAAVRSAAAKLAESGTAGSSEEDRLVAARRHIEALEAELVAARSETEQALDFAAEEEDKARLAQAGQHGLRVRVQALGEVLRTRGIEPDTDLERPTTWDGFTDWCDEALAGRVVLASQARRKIKKADFEDPGLAAECLVWLASTCRDHRIQGGGSLANIPVRHGIQNAPCGSDTFEFDWQDRRLVADWHVKNGGNTRDPTRCLRIYYCFDAITQQMVVADMPAHRRTSAT